MSENGELTLDGFALSWLDKGFIWIRRCLPFIQQGIISIDFY
jgi:hypothetical protein